MYLSTGYLVLESRSVNPLFQGCGDAVIRPGVLQALPRVHAQARKRRVAARNGRREDPGLLGRETESTRSVVCFRTLQTR